MIKNYFSIAFRSLYRNILPNVINIGGLAVALSVVVLILLWVQHERSYNSVNSDADHIFLLTEFNSGSGEYSESAPYAASQAIKSEIPEVERVAVAFPGSYMDLVFALDDKRFFERDLLFIDSNWINLLDYRITAGSFDRLRTEPNVIAISESKAEHYFGREPAVGKTIVVDSIPTTVVAVFADVPANSTFHQGVLLPHQDLLKKTYFQNYTDEWGAYIPYVIIKPHRNADPAVIASKITPIFAKNQPYKEEGEFHHHLVPLSGIHLGGFQFSTLPQGNKQSIVIFSALAFLLLLTASVNFVNLSIARMTTRHKEIGIRKVSGAAKWQLFNQIMTETLVTVLISSVVTLLLVVLLLPHFNRYFETSLVFSLADVETLVLLAATFVVVMLLTGVYPALLTGKASPLNLFKGRVLEHSDNRRFREMLMVGQMVLAVAMVVAVIVIHRQFKYIQLATEAYQMDQVFIFQRKTNTGEVIYPGSPEQANYLRGVNTLKEELLRNSSIKAVTRVNGASLIDNPRSMGVEHEWIGYPKKGNLPKAVRLWVDHDYLDLADIELVAGRWFDDNNVSDQNNIIINETAINAFGLNEPVVGTTFDVLGMYQGTIIGVVKDFHHASLHQPIEPVIIELDQHAMGGKFMVEAQDGRVAEALAVTEAAWKRQYPDKPFEYTFLDEEFDRLYKSDRKALVFSMVFAAMSLLISALGILAMAMFVTQQRVKEVGIRKVLGASVSEIVALLSRDFVKLVFLAILIATPIAWWAMTKWLEDFAYRIDIQWWMFATAGLVAMVIALLTVSWQAIRAAVANPVDSLRDE
ncbi:MAG TPA: ABC transporter permease [Parapedobacter sp.]|uniref:ABC transporter permease n=1 Tax=Parapedobacter sp. TaxID=1958893 RepID=UPI002C5CFF01|nr:ABC transporter permease [Parapedobacter sp.]HWK58852.1 ABC transporter permease [Parapedobacter sp.]